MELTDILQQIDSLKQEAENLQPVKPELEKVFWNKFMLEFNYNSNHMEGNTLTYPHTELLLIFGKVTGDYSFRELEEMKAHNVALEKIKLDVANIEFAFTEKFIKDINTTILVEPYYRDAIDTNGNPSKKLIKPGDYKELPNHVQLRNGEVFYFSQPQETRAHMGDLMNWYKTESEKKELHITQLAALFHYRFVRIHPFDDGNGRTARLIMNYILLKNGFAPIVIESKNKADYLAALNKADVGDINAFVDYIAGLSRRWQEIYLKSIKGENVEEPDDFEKEVELLKKQVDNGKKIQLKFSNETVLSLFSDCLFDLFKSSVEKTSKLDYFFYEKEVLFGLSGKKQVATDVYRIKELFAELRQQVSVGTYLDLEIQHKGFRTNDNRIFNYTSTIQVYFREYNYHVSLNPNQKPIIEKFYSELLSQNEIESFATALAKEELNEIKKRQELL